MKNRKKTYFFIGIALFATIAIIVVLSLTLFSNQKRVVSKAFQNTFLNINQGKNQLLSDLNTSDIVDSKEYTVSYDIDTEIEKIGDITVFGDISFDDKKMESNGNLDISYVPLIEYTFLIDEGSVCFETPIFPNRQFVYEYTEENDGFISEKIDTELLNKALQQMYNDLFGGERNNVMYEEFQSMIADEYGLFKVVKIPSKEFSVDQTTIQAKGYRIEISKDQIVDFADKLDDYCERNLDRILKLNSITSEDILNSVYEYAESTGDITADVYVYKNELACVDISSGRGKKTILFKGGDYRAQNITYLENDKEVLSIVSDIDTSGETFSVIYDSKTIFDYSYTDEVLILHSGENEYRAKIKSDKDSVGISVDYIDFGQTYFGGKFSIRSGKSEYDISGDIFDVGKASEKDFLMLEEEAYAIVAGLMGW